VRAAYHEPESGARLRHCEASRMVSAGKLNSHTEEFRDVQLGSPAPIPRAATEFYSIMSHASGNALGGAISPADVSFVQQHGHNQVR
jgi:hypothetical protein